VTTLLSVRWSPKRGVRVSAAPALISDALAGLE